MQPGTGRDLTTGPITSAIWVLAVPMILGSIVRTTWTLVDMFWVGKLGAPALAAVGMSAQVMFVLSTVFMGVGVASTAMVARAIGAGDRERADRVAAQSLLLTLAISIVVTAAGFALAPVLLRGLRASKEVQELGTTYLRIRFVGIAAMFSLFVGAGILRGAGDAVTPFLISSFAAVLNIALDPLLIFGWLGFPALGVRGAAIASVVSQGVGFLMGAAVLASGRTRIRLRFRAFRPDFSVVWRIVAIGVPSAVQMSLRSLMGMALMWIVAGFGTTVVAAFAVGRRLQMVAFMPAFGLAAASAALVGQNLGANKPDRAQKSALISMGMTLAIMGTIGLATFILAPRLVSAFNQEPEVVAAGTSYLRIVTFGYAFAACGIVLGRAISGAGDTVPPMLITLVGLWFLQAPLAYALAQWTGLAEQGVWWANVAASVALATMTGTYFFIGRWKRKRL